MILYCRSNTAGAFLLSSNSLEGWSPESLMLVFCGGVCDPTQTCLCSLGLRKVK